MEKIFYKQRAKFNKEEARQLWIDGWCWRALGEKYGCHAITVKKYIKMLTESDRDSHRNKHNYECPLCRINPNLKLL